MRADRYLRTGEPVPQIYPGTLTALIQAEKDVQRVSTRQPGEHTLFALYGREWNLIRVYQSGECTWTYSAADDG